MREIPEMPHQEGELWYPENFPLKPRYDTEQAIRRYYNYFTGNVPVPTKTEVKLLADFLVYFIHAPIWSMGPDKGAMIGRLQKMANEMVTIDQIHAFLEECLDVGIDPF